MDHLPTLGLPFIDRSVLKFEHGATFSLQLKSQAGKLGDITLRGMTREGSFSFNQSPTNDGILNTDTFSIPDIPIFLAVVNTSGDYNQGDCFCTVTLLLNGTPLYVICSGFIYQQRPLSFPTQQAGDTMPARARIKQVSSANPAAGQEISIAVPANRMWRLIGMRFQLVCAAAAASRRVHIVVDLDDGGTEFNAFSDVDQIISETKNYTAAQFGDLPDRTDDDDILIPIAHELYIPDGGTIYTKTTNLNAGDNFSAADLLVEEIFTRDTS